MEPLATSVQVLPGYRLVVTFEDGTSGVVDCTSWLFERDTGVFAPLRDPQLFAQVFVNEELGTIEWPNGADVAPETLYEEAQKSAVK
jgi:Protein of unknown function (DUF2442)